MKPKFRLVLAAALPFVAISYAHAQSTWIGATGGEWGTASNWDTNPVLPNATDAAANINTALTVNVSDTGTGGSYPYTFGSLATSLASGSVVIGTTSVTTDVLTAAVSSGTPAINVANGTANIFFYANLEGSQGFEKTGAGKLTFRFNGSAQIYTGDVTISGGILGINQNSSLGDDENDIFIAGGARLLAEPGSNSGTITLPATRTITLGGFQSQIGSNNPAVDLVIDGEVAENAPGNGLVKTDGGKVTLAGTLSYTGETRIAGGTLALGGTATLPSDQNLRFNGGSGTLDIGATSQFVRTIVMDNTTGSKTITGGGSLTVNGDANLVLSGANGANYDFSGIDSFTYDSSGRNLSIQTVNAAAAATLHDVFLAKSGTSGGSNTITAAQLQLGGGNSDGNSGNTARLHLGTLNTINANTINLGGFNAGGMIDFQTGLTDPSLTLRATDGTSAVSLMKVGETSSGSRTGSGTLNLAGGSLDALLTELVIGRHIASATVADTSSLTMPSGTLTASIIKLSEKLNNGTPTITSTFTQEGGTVSVDLMVLGIGGGEAARLLPTYRLWGGTLAATIIQSGGGNFAANSSRNLILRDGTLTNQTGADLSISGITVTVAGNTTTVVNSTPGQKVVLAGDVTYSARMNSAAETSGALTVNGVLDLTAQPAFGIFDDASTAAELAPGTKLVLIDYTNGSVAGTFASLADGDTVSVTKGAVTNNFIIDYDDLGGTAVTLTIPTAGDNYDTWATDNGINGEAFEDDFDKDGISNGIEYALGLNPIQSSQPPGVLSGNTISFTKGADAIANGDVSWVIETSETLALGSWTPEVTQDAGDPAATISHAFTLGTPPREFARLKVVRVP